MPIGPANITAYGNFNFSTSAWTHYIVTLQPQRAANTANTSASWDSFRINKTEGNCDYNGVRFAWVNDYGVWDYYTFGLQNEYNNPVSWGSFQSLFPTGSSGGSNYGSNSSQGSLFNLNVRVGGN